MTKETMDDLIKEIIDGNDAHWGGWRETPIWYWMVCIGGEAGELLNKLKKYYRRMWGWKGKSLSHEEFQKEGAIEIGDILIYCFLTLEQLGLDPSEVLRMTLEKNYKRFKWYGKGEIDEETNEET